ncbi:MAG: stage II sporulation protein D [Clostridia bacterium]|nr:stage II sporulation protein D [Clostridia bacterium]
MKTVYIITMLITALLMLTLPLCAKNNIDRLPVSALPTENVQAVDTDETVKVKLTDSNEVINISLKDYLFGVVAAEMPALYEKEALKAQAVVAYTYYILKKDSNSGSDYDISDDFTTDQSFITVEKAREKWGDGADEFENKIRSAIDEVFGKRVLYSGKPAYTVYHAISFGVTENAVDVWGNEYPYLVSVDSSFDKLEKNYLSKNTFTAEELKNAMSPFVSITNTTENQITDIVRTNAGGVKSANISGVSVSGQDIRKALSLRSSNFEVSFADGVYTFDVKGYGHSVGMSQYGAHYLAMQGKNYKEILEHYYTGCTVE